MSTRVAIVEADRYQLEYLMERIEEIIASTDFPEVRDKIVFLKPNVLSDANPEKAITTNPVFVEALVKVIQKREPREILMGDSPGLHTPTVHARNAGLWDVCERTGVTWVDFTKETRVHKLTRKISAPMTTAIDKADVIISLAKMKTHQLMFFTGCVKNMFGLLPGLNKSPMHVKAPSREAFAKIIVSIFRESRTTYAFMDGIIGMEGPGPANGYPRRFNLLFGSKDAFAIDYAASSIMGYDPDEIPIWKEGSRQNLTQKSSYEYPILEPQELKIKDVQLVEQKKSNLFADLIWPILTRPFRMKMVQKRPAPQFMDNCIRCQRCINICPASALKLVDNKVTIDKSLCIRCYCCHEMCPVDAIKIDRQG